MTMGKKGGDNIDYSVLRQLIELVEQAGLSELTIHTHKWTISLRRQISSNALRPTVNEQVSQLAQIPFQLPSVASKPAADLHQVTSPLTGVFYRRPAPQEPPFVEIGSYVEAGQIVALVESMKVFNEIIADVNGVVVEICVEDGQLVQQGDALIILRREGQ
ncbi:MAG TPA: acetyl-CoA carboxylase biotin carboxyl carrier protein [Armatimonadetes bacterium]|nr:acetyl-CoA carboxylase biotin carboxyl carrier protein [Armatimonadota bacterium]